MSDLCTTRIILISHTKASLLATGRKAPIPPLTRLVAATASNGLLTDQILFSLAFVGSYELANWISIMW